MSRILLVGVDLFFRAKIDAMLSPRGHVVTARAGDEPPDVVIADVNRADPMAVLAEHAGVPVLGFGQHTDPARLREARQAGFVQAVPRSVLVERLPELVEQALGARR